nr:PPOX class F420-dependent oxidoreductase [uncultured Actinoplanes sp.]
MTDLPQRLRDLLEAPSICLLATTNPDGAPQLTEVWTDTDGKHILINTVEGHRKLKNVRRDPRVAVSVLDRDDPSTYYSIAGTVTSIDHEGAGEHIERLSQKYTGGPYRNYRGTPQVRVLLTIRVDRIVHAPRG